MSRDNDREFEIVLRETLEGFDGTQPPVELASRALGQSRRIRRARRLATGAALLAAVAACVVPYKLMQEMKAPQQRPAATSQATSLPGPALSPGTGPQLDRFQIEDGAWEIGGWRAAGWSSDDPAQNSIVYLPAEKSYLRVPYMGARRSPAGSEIAVYGSGARPGELSGFLDPATSQVRWMSSTALMDATWSPDGKRLLVSSLRGPTGTFSIVDPVTLESRQFKVTVPCARLCRFFWHPNGRDVVVTATTPSREPLGIDVFPTDQGPEPKAKTRLPVKAYVEDGTAWSPDGKYVVANSEPDGKPMVYEVATGSPVAAVPGQKALTTYWIDNATYLTFSRNDDGHGRYTAHRVDGTPTGLSKVLPAEFAWLSPVPLEKAG
ncbi:TolB family protein [Longispora albida]|uniref:TolB family protein n=1 Tax=Longispora albida TaxID=203523 RepID=UPI00036B8EC2|nr:PD40 domain-containing protein [Longispora albida]